MTDRGQPCAIPTVDGSGECTHPSVIDSVSILGSPWHGYRYWMAFTPYPGNDDRRFRLENPSVVASHDGIEWIVPEGVANPLIPPPGLADLGRSIALDVPPRRLLAQIRGVVLRKSYNADPAMYLSPEGIMYLAYVHSFKGGSHDELLLVESADGWRSLRRRGVLVRTNREGNTHEVNVPSIVDAGDSTIHLYYGHVPAGDDGEPRYDRVGIRRRSGPCLDSLGPPVDLKVQNPPGRRLWHHEVRRDHGGQIVCLATFAPDTGPKDRMLWPPSLSLYLGRIHGDSLVFDDRPILEASTDGWDSQCIYKPSFLTQPGSSGEEIYLWYSAQNARTREWRIGFTVWGKPWQ